MSLDFKRDAGTIAICTSLWWLLGVRLSSFEQWSRFVNPVFHSTSTMMEYYLGAMLFYHWCRFGSLMNLELDGERGRSDRESLKLQYVTLLHGLSHISIIGTEQTSFPW